MHTCIYIRSGAPLLVDALGAGMFVNRQHPSGANRPHHMTYIHCMIVLLVFPQIYAWFYFVHLLFDGLGRGVIV